MGWHGPAAGRTDDGQSPGRRGFCTRDGMPDGGGASYRATDFAAGVAAVGRCYRDGGDDGCVRGGRVLRALGIPAVPAVLGGARCGAEDAVAADLCAEARGTYPARLLA